MAKQRRKKADDFSKDPRAVALANCVLFALGAFKNKPLFDGRTDAPQKVTTWHAWFKEVLRDAGYGDLPQAKE